MIELEEIAATIGSLPDVLRALLQPIDDDVLRIRPSEDEWSVLEVIGHLIEIEAPAFRDRIEAIVGGAPEIAAAPPTAGETRDFNIEPLDRLIAELAEERRKSAAYLLTLTSEDLATTAAYPKSGIFAAGDFVHEWPFHDQDHLQQILSVLKLTYLPHMTELMRTALTDTEQ